MLTKKQSKMVEKVLEMVRQQAISGEEAIEAKQFLNSLPQTNWVKAVSRELQSYAVNTLMIDNFDEEM